MSEKHELGPIRASRGEGAKRTLFYAYCSCGHGIPSSSSPSSVEKKHREHVAAVRPEQLEAALRRVAEAYTAWAEDWNDGTYAYWRSDDLMVACVEARKLLADAGHRGVAA